MSRTVELNGVVEDIFGHRFTLKGEDGKQLIDLGPGGEHLVTIEPGRDVCVRGERKPSEVKATDIRVGGGEWQDIKPRGDAGPKPPHAGKDHERHGPDKKPEIGDEDEQVTKLLNDEGYTNHGQRTRKAKHVEVIATKDGRRHKVHVHKDGVRKAEPID